MEVEIDTKLPKEEEIDSSDDEKVEDKDLLQTEFLSLNNFDNTESRYLMVGTYGNSSAYLKSALYEEIKRNTKAFKGKFLQSSNADKKAPKKVVAELYQFTENESSNLILLLKKDLSFQSYKFIVDFLLNDKLKVSSVVILRSVLYKDIIYEGNKEEIKQSLFVLKNSIQQQCNQLIRGNELPKFNGASGFTAYLFTKTEILSIPCVLYTAAHTEYDVCFENLSIFDKCSITYAFLRQKMTQDYIKEKNIPLSDIVSEFNSYKAGIYS